MEEKRMYSFLMIAIVSCCMTAVSVNAATITDLFNALKDQPQYKIDLAAENLGNLGAQKVTDQFYPKGSFFATYEHYNSPTNLRPVPPTELIELGNSNPYPFAQTIQRVGVKASLPIFVKELFSSAKKAKALAQSAQLKKRLTFYQNEAVVLSTNAQLLYLNHLENAMIARKASLSKIYEDVKLKVDVGRASGSALDNIENGLNRLEVAINDIHIKNSLLKSKIEGLTGITIEEPVALALHAEIAGKKIFPLKPIQSSIEAKKAELQSRYDKLFPKIVLSGMWSGNYAQDDVLLGEDVDRDYGRYMISFTVPIFEKSNFTDIQMSKVLLSREKYKLKKVEQELVAQAKSLKEQLVLYDQSLIIDQKSIQNRKNLLKFAKVSLAKGRMIEEEYLRYEEALLDSQAKFYEIEAKKWQILSQLAVIYGNDLKGVVE